ncbi:hypothetical protein [Gottfriedia solisilvae]|uniref:Uncharacterized protein n=1 Tax=Gottfriedia solisilvae TaxID=1516104 RepID=A0A8J3EZ59_9BACI|nr:hypothetical protein [Gottfriedia solisilvae]GGI14947.1 hypothetical protein GCM10007380_25500 [Gottfriedia solisilvae]
MRKMVQINEITFNNENAMMLIIENHTLNLANCHEVGTMIADSDQSSLLYIIEENEEFVYVTVPVEYWPEMKKAYDLKSEVFLQVGEAKFPLENWQNELTFLVQNVDGNFNYGEEFVKQIQSVFLEEK